ncbi:enoyl-CoA hydratase/isomerase family protein [Parapusillimonas granuli]|uniref:Enoyl-CoA hydratase/isomerase family protein n=1 Tax=Parapusillimonas granuli TaxID=380911 RepID=A0A853FXQ5_9BURK|nr:enoyl-CoA hydratase/isomerase family protein [Parapusillimonas granuli]MBB5214695.1 enoyl-CoA hydratase [Parapusillimonas granuli]MEB2398057.1 enoyl-CoA hydratase/isomerase family protein [Alcaligenaceae bacterium]NYT48897.1 enoyl-CoA hydratase/isomerase family protein [Parapusillimonas granuli]
MSIQTDVAVEIADYVATVTMARNPVNAADRAFRKKLIEVFDELGERKDVRCVVLQSSAKAFSAGVDLKDRPDPELWGDITGTHRLTRETFNAVRECVKPVIGVVDGPAIGFGMVLAISCDIIVAAENAWFSMPEINVGLAGGVAAVQSFVPRSLARRLLFTGARITAKELAQFGVLEAVPPERLDAFASALAKELASKSPPALRYAKRSGNFAELMTPTEAYKFEQHYTTMLASSIDGLEARRAMLEKRPPIFTED